MNLSRTHRKTVLTKNYFLMTARRTQCSPAKTRSVVQTLNACPLAAWICSRKTGGCTFSRRNLIRHSKSWKLKREKFQKKAAPLRVHQTHLKTIWRLKKFMKKFSIFLRRSEKKWFRRKRNKLKNYECRSKKPTKMYCKKPKSNKKTGYRQLRATFRRAFQADEAH